MLVCVCVISCYFSLQYFPDRFVRREIMNLKVCCENKRDGCQWKDSFSHYLVSGLVAWLGFSSNLYCSFIRIMFSVVNIR